MLRRGFLFCAKRNGQVFRLHQLPLYKYLGLSLPAAEACAREVLSLPLWPHIPARLQAEIASALLPLLSSRSPT